MSINNLSLKNYILFLASKYKAYLILLTLAAIFAGGFEISIDYKIKEIIDMIAEDSAANVGYLLFLFALYKLMHHLAYFVFRILDSIYKPKIIEQTVIDIYSKTVRHSLQWFDSHLSGEISNKVYDFQDSVTNITSNLFTVLNTIVTAVMMLWALFNVNIFSAFVLIGFVIIYIPVIWWLLKKQIRLNESSERVRQNAVGIINDSISNIFCIKVIGSLFAELKLKLQPAVTKWRDWDKRVRSFEAYVVDNADTVLVTLMSTIQIYLLAYLYKKGDITAGSFAFIAMMTLKIQWKLGNVLEHILFQINPGIATMKASYQYINSAVDVEDKEGAYELRNASGDIKYSNVEFAYESNNKLVLSNFNLTVKAGERVGVVGMSGAGKTTVMKCLLRYFDVSGGSIAIDGHDIRDISQESLREAISMIPQDITMFHRSVRENLQMAKHGATEKEIIAACKRAKIHKDIMAMPQGYETIVGERGTKLSGGQRQRIAIARAILKNAPVLILDEATSSLDTATEQLIQDSINHILEDSKATVIAIAHRLSTIKHMDRIIVLDKGRIVEEGTHFGLLRKKRGFYKKLWEMQAI
jgi:ATP-binding cassette subfamily B protein